MSISMALLTPPPPTHFVHNSHSSSPNLHFPHKPFSLSLLPTKSLFLASTPRASADNGASAVAVEVEEPSGSSLESEKKISLKSNGVVADAEVEKIVESKFLDGRWVNGTWDLKQFHKDGNTDWDAVIDAEVQRRKWLEGNPESSSNDDPVIFDTSIIPWWAWMKRFHLPEAELLNGRAAMVGFFMAYFVDSLTGVGLVDQMGNFFCKTLLFVAVAGVLLIRKNEDVETIKKLVEETTFYDKQWQATWQDDPRSSSKLN